MKRADIAAELVAVLVAVTEGQLRVLTLQRGQSLPAGPFQVTDRSLQASLRQWVEQQTGHPLGYVEQLYTFADRDRRTAVDAPHVISISYLGLTREDPACDRLPAEWRDIYAYFPWEDHRQGSPPALRDLLPRLSAWAGEEAGISREREARIAITFGLEAQAWNEEFALQRYELLYEAGLVREAGLPDHPRSGGLFMTADHRRILATALARLRAKIKYRPVVFELMPPEFTLLQLQQGVEAIAGRGLHKGNFRRLIEAQELVEETGGITTATPGRPAKLFRFRRQVLAERAVTGTKLSLPRM